MRSSIHTAFALACAGLLLSGCCSLEPPPSWAGESHPPEKEEFLIVGEARGRTTRAEAQSSARKSAAQQAAALVLGKRATPSLLAGLTSQALKIATTVKQFDQGCDDFEAWVLLRWNRETLRALSASTQREEAGTKVDTERLRRTARSLLAAGKPVAAAKEARRLCQAAPQDAEAQWLLGEAIRLDLARPSVARAGGASQDLFREAKRAYDQAQALSTSDDLSERARQGQVALRAKKGDAWQARFEALVRRVREGKRPPEEALLALTKAVTPETAGTQRAFLQERALDVEVHALVTALAKALPAGASVAVFEPEWPRSGYADEDAAAALAKLGRLVSDALVNRRFVVRRPSEIDERRRSAGQGPAEHANAYVPAGREALRKLLEADVAILLVGGQRATATAYDLRQGHPLPPIGRVYHPTGEAWSGVKSPDPIRAEVAFLGERLDASGMGESNVQVTDGVELRLGDQIQCRLKLDQSSYTYLIWIDSQSKVWRVFPETERVLPSAPKAAKNPLPKGTHWIPGGSDPDFFFSLAGKPGRETLYLVVARKPLQHLAALERALANGEVKDPRQTLRKFLGRQAGQAGSLRAASSQEPGVVLEGPNLLVRELTFRLTKR